MSKSAFTLLELLLAMAIMGVLGTISVAGYRAVQRGLEERGVMDNVAYFLNAADQRAQVDRRAVAVFCWNECVREETEDAALVAVGRAVAVRRVGRITKVDSGNRLLMDEFADLRYTSVVIPTDEENGLKVGNANQEFEAAKKYQIPFYKLNGNGELKKYYVSQFVKDATRNNTEVLLSIQPYRQTEIPCYGYYCLNGVNDWKVGDAYGFEFEEITLPKNYIFGSSIPKDADSEPTIVKRELLEPRNAGVGNFSVEICSIRPDGSADRVGVAKLTNNP